MLSQVERRLSGKGRQLAEEAARRAHAYMRRDQIQRETAAVARGLLANPDVKPLDLATRRMIADYTERTFGSAVHAPWLEVYTLYRGAFHEGWVPADVFMYDWLERLNGGHRTVGWARSLHGRIVGADALPDIAHFVGGEWRDPQGEHIDGDAVAARIFADGGRVCVKTDASRKGLGVRFVTPNTFDRQALEALGDFVVQRAIVQDEGYAAMFPGAVATLRIGTGKPRGERPRFLYAYLRLGAGDAAAVVQGSSIKVPIVDAQGRLGPIGSDHAWRRLRTHPDTGFRFEGAAAPRFADAVDRCVALHDRAPQFGFIGFDVAVDVNGRPQVMEINLVNPGIRFAEMALGPCLDALRPETVPPQRRVAAARLN